MKGSRTVKQGDGWIIVTKGPSGRHKSSDPKEEHTAEGSDDPQSEPQLDRLLKRYRKFRQLFRDSRYWSSLRSTLDTLGELRIDSAVCLGLGSLASAQSTLVDRSLWQLVLFQEVTDLWQERNPIQPIVRYAQDLRATKVDKNFMARIDVALLEHPAGIEKIKDTTFLYDPFLPWAVMLTDVLPGISPALYLGSTMEGIADMCEDDTGLVAIMKCEGSERNLKDIESALDGARGFLKRRSKIGTPADFEHHANVFRGMLILVEKSMDESVHTEAPQQHITNPKDSGTEQNVT